MQQIQIAFGQDSTTIYDLDSVQRYTVEDVASTKTFAAANACALLQWVYGDGSCTDLDIEYGQGSKMEQGVESLENDQEYATLSVHPNPADESVVIEFSLSKMIGEPSLELLGVTGKVYYQSQQAISDGSVIVKTKDVPSGV